MAGLVQKQLQQQQQQLGSTRCPIRPSLNVRRVRSPAVSVQAYLSGATRSSFVSGSSSWASGPPLTAAALSGPLLQRTVPLAPLRLSV